MNASGIDLDDQIIVESGLDGRSHTRFAGQRIAFFVLFPVDQEDFQPFSPDLSPDRGNFWLNHQSVRFLPGSLPPSHLVRQAWDETVRVTASIHHRIVSASLILHRLGSYARQNSVHQALAEIGRVHKTIHILRTLDDEEYRRRMGRELNKGEASHDLSRFLCFGKEGALRGREFADQIHTFSCLSDSVRLLLVTAISLVTDAAGSVLVSSRT